MTPVPISKSGKNALDFHLSFYMGYIASRNQQAKIVVVANDKGYKAMLEHAKAMGFAVRQYGHTLQALLQSINTAEQDRLGCRQDVGTPCPERMGTDSFRAVHSSTRRSSVGR